MRNVPRAALSRSGESPLSIEGIPSASALAKRGGVVLTFGIFDGVHQSHQAMLQQVLRRAKAIQASSAVVVFRPRPIESLELSPPRPYFTAEDETVRAIEHLGIRHVGVLRFNKELTEMPAGQFLRRLVLRLPVQELWLGPDAKVGRGAEGSLPSIQRIGAELGFQVRRFSAPEELATTGSLVNHFHAKDLRGVAQDLGRPYKLPAYIGESVPLAERSLVLFRLVTPTRLYAPSDGHYAVMVSPASFGGVRPRRNSAPGPGVVLITTSRYFGAHPELSLIGNAGMDWSESFANLEFLEAFEPPVGQLWQWATRLGEDGRPAEGSAESAQSAEAAVGGQGPRPPHSIRS
jgi:riboflavin kinase/FMN adenylyltransferase